MSVRKKQYRAQIDGKVFKKQRRNQGLCQIQITLHPCCTRNGEHNAEKVKTHEQALFGQKSREING